MAERQLSYNMHPSCVVEDTSLAFFGISQTQPSHLFGPSLRSAVIIHIILSGQGTLRAGGHEYTLRQGDGFIIRPGSPSIYQASQDNPWTYLWMGFRGEATERHLAALGLGAGHEAFRVHGAFPFLNIVTECLSHATDGIEDELKLNALGYEFLHLLADQLVSDKTAELDFPADGVSAKAVAYISEHYAEGIGAADVADALHVDRSYLSRQFHKDVGQTPKEYIDHMRVIRACDLLNLTTMSVGEVAKACGYGSLELFNRKFKASQMMTPSQFRSIYATLKNDLDIDISFFRAIFAH